MICSIQILNELVELGIFLPFEEIRIALLESVLIHGDIAPLGIVRCV
jgi:hypothetical protein